MEKTKYVYKILRKSDGLYSTGGYGPRFTKTGKTWSNLGGLSNHLNLVYHNTAYNGRPLNTIYDDCVVMTYKVVLDTQDCSPDYIENAKNKAIERHNEAVIRRAKYEEQRKELNEKQRLLEEYKRKLGL